MKNKTDQTMTQTQDQTQAAKALYLVNQARVENYGIRNVFDDPTDRALFNTGRLIVAGEKAPTPVKVGTKPNTGGRTGKYNKVFDYAARALIETLVAGGAHQVRLAYLYTELGATEPDQQCGVLWAVRHAKDNKVLANTTTKGVYNVVA